MNYKKIIFFCRRPKYRFGGIWSVVSQQVRIFELEREIFMVTSFIDLCRELKLFAAKRTIIFVHGFSDISLFRYLIFRLLSLENIPVIWQPHAHAFNAHRRPLLARAYFSLVGRMVSRVAEKVIAVSPLERKVLIELGVLPQKVVVLPNCIDNKWRQFFTEAESPSADCLFPTSNPPLKNFCLIVSRDEPNKYLDRAENQIALLKGLGLSTVLICPNPKPTRRFSRIIEYLDDVNLAQLFFQAKIVLIPSKFEAFSLVGIQAIQMGTPVICWENVGLASFSGASEFVLTAKSETLTANEIEQALIIKDQFPRRSAQVWLENFGPCSYESAVKEIVDPTNPVYV